MTFNYITGPLEEIKVDTIVLFVPAYKKTTNPSLKRLDKASGMAVTTLLDSEEFTGKQGENAVLYSPDGYQSRRIILAGLGEKSDLCPDSFRQAAGTVSRHKGLSGSAKAAFYFDKYDNEAFFQAAIEGYLLGAYTLLEYKTGEGKVDKRKIKSLTFAVAGAKSLKKMTRAIERGQIIAEGQLMVRDLASAPANMLTPRILAAKAEKLARTHKLSCKVLDEKQIAKEKMGALLSVARGSKEPPRFIALQYKGGRAGQAPVVLVGKGVTFDAGGISLKQALNMHEMKGDMTGAAVVLSTIVTAARLKLPINLVSLIPATENLPSGTATRPGDIITSRKGLTIEVINTDAEGRLILADALDYANEYKPQAVLDIATLTGATLYSLGYAGAPIFSNRRTIISQLQAAAGATAERVWEFPIWDDYREGMKSRIADLVNSGGRDAGTCKAAAFLENFIGDWPWGHIDIAYVDLEPSGKPYIPRGITGIGLRLLIELLSHWKKPGK